MAHRIAGAAFCAVALWGLKGCGSESPFIAGEAEEAGEQVVTAPDGTPEDVVTEDPDTLNEVYLFDPGAKLTVNAVVYDPVNDELVINNLPFEGPDGRYDRVRTQGAAGVY